MIDKPTAARSWACLLVVGALGFAGQPARADEQADRIKALEQRLEGSLKLIEKLGARVNELERALPAATSAPQATTPAASTEPRGALAVLQENVDQISRGLSLRGDDTGLPLHGFADVGGAWSRGADPVKLRGFNIGTLDLYLTPHFGGRVRSLVELAFEYEEDGGGEVDLERMQLGYAFSDALTLWAGRFHTPFGLWNTSFHHGANLQTSLSRPRFVEFEDKGGIVPAHSVGFWASGRARLGQGKIVYDGYLSNGPRIRDRHLNFNAFTDDNAGKMLGGSLAYEPSGALSGLTVGVHGFGSTVNAYASSGLVLSQTKLRMKGGYFGYDGNDWEAIGEYYRFTNTGGAGGARLGSSAWFVHVGRMFGTLTPYVRYERTALSAADAYFSSQRAGRSYKRVVAGARYALDARSSLKLELSETMEASVLQIDQTGGLVPFTAANYRRAAFQYSIAF